MRLLVSLVVAAALVVAPARSARAAEPGPDAAVAVAIGAATIFAGLAIGGTLVAASGENPSKNEAGWLVLEGGFALAPFAAHGVVGEWGRGAAFASLPAAAMLGSLPVFVADQDTIGSGKITEQAVLWGCLVAGLATSVVGVIDAAFAPGRALRVAPTLGPGQAGLVIGGVL